MALFSSFCVGGELKNNVNDDDEQFFRVGNRAQLKMLFHEWRQVSWVGREETCENLEKLEWDA